MVVKQASALLPGLGVLVLFGLAARWLSTVLPLNHLIIAIVLGILVANTVGLPEWTRPGVSTYQLLLEIGIVILGVRLTFEHALGAGPKILTLVVVFIALTIAVVTGAAKLIGVGGKTRPLIASGLSICGVSAVVAVAGSIRANEEEVAYAVATVLLFDALTLFAYPVLGTVLGLPEQVYGIWAGISMFSTGPVTAAGFAVSDTAGQWATITKLTRNVFIGVVAVGYTISHLAPDESADGPLTWIWYIWCSFPKVVLGFALMVVVANLGVLSGEQVTSLTHAYQWLFLLAFVGLGLNIHRRDLTDAGIKPIAIAFVGLLVVSPLALAATLFVFG